MYFVADVSTNQRHFQKLLSGHQGTVYTITPSPTFSQIKLDQITL